MTGVWVVSCAGGCGKRLKRGMNSLAQPMCRSCRKRHRVILCEYCSKPFRPGNGALEARTCSVSHGLLVRWLEWHAEHDPKPKASR